MSEEITGTFCPMIDGDCVQEKCQWAYFTKDNNGEVQFNWCRIHDIARALENIDGRMNGRVEGME